MPIYYEILWAFSLCKCNEMKIWHGMNQFTLAVLKFQCHNPSCMTDPAFGGTLVQKTLDSLAGAK